jgi:hypothetical protein
MEVRWQANRRLWFQANYGIFYAGKVVKESQPGRNLNYRAFGQASSFRETACAVRHSAQLRRLRAQILVVRTGAGEWDECGLYFFKGFLSLSMPKLKPKSNFAFAGTGSASAVTRVGVAPLAP